MCAGTYVWWNASPHLGPLPPGGFSLGGLPFFFFFIQHLFPAGWLDPLLGGGVVYDIPWCVRVFVYLVGNWLKRHLFCPAVVVPRNTSVPCSRTPRVPQRKSRREVYLGGWLRPGLYGNPRNPLGAGWGGDHPHYSHPGGRGEQNFPSAPMAYGAEGDFFAQWCGGWSYLGGLGDKQGRSVFGRPWNLSPPNLHICPATPEGPCPPREFTTVEDYQTSVDVRVFEGERSITDGNHLLGEFVISGIERAKRGVPPWARPRLDGGARIHQCMRAVHSFGL